MQLMGQLKNPVVFRHQPQMTQVLYNSVKGEIFAIWLSKWKMQCFIFCSIQQFILSLFVFWVGCRAKISQLEKELIEDLKALRHKQVIHPGLQEGNIFKKYIYKPIFNFVLFFCLLFLFPLLSFFCCSSPFLFFLLPPPHSWFHFF